MIFDENFLDSLFMSMIRGDFPKEIADKMPIIGEEVFYDDEFSTPSKGIIMEIDQNILKVKFEDDAEPDYVYWAMHEEDTKREKGIKWILNPNLTWRTKI